VMRTVTSFSEQVAAIIQDIIARQKEIKEEFIKAWLAEAIPADKLTAENIIQSVELVETWSNDRLSVRWHFRLKEKQ
jgi:hypothetical protein